MTPVEPRSRRPGAGPEDAPVAACAAALLVLPWLWPFATGPWPAAQQTLLTSAVLALLLLLLVGARLSLAHAAAWSWLLAALASSAIGLVQYAGWSADFQPWVDATRPGQAFANLRQPNQFATLTGIGLACLLWGPVADWQARWRPASRSGRVAAGAGLVIVVLLLAAGNAASRSRTGLLQWLLVLPLLAGVWGGWRQPRLRAVLLVAVAGYGGAALLLPWLVGGDPIAQGIAGRLQSSGVPCGSRLVLWDNVLHLIALRPWTGWGWGELDFAHFSTLYPGPRFCEILDNAHNLPLQLAVELGLPLAVLLLGALLVLVWRARPWREAAGVPRLGWAVLALIGVHSLLEYPLWYAPFLLAAGLALQLLVPTLAERLRRWPWPVGGAAIVLLAGTAYAAWDYHRVSQIYLAPRQRAAAYRVDTLQHALSSRLFANQARFAELTIAEVTPANAAFLYALSRRMLHFSPESRVVERLIASAAHLGHTAEAEDALLRYRIAYPAEFERWLAAQAAGEVPPVPGLARLLQAVRDRQGASAAR